MFHLTFNNETLHFSEAFEKLDYGPNTELHATCLLQQNRTCNTKNKRR